LRIFFVVLPLIQIVVFQVAFAQSESESVGGILPLNLLRLEYVRKSHLSN
jgi:hypothetical protein